MKKQVNAVLSALADGILITLAVLATPCAVLTAYSVPFPLVPLVFASVGIGLILSVWMHTPKFGVAAGILYFAVITPLLLWKRLDILYGFRIVRYAMVDMLAPDVPFIDPPATVQVPIGLNSLPIDAVGWFVLLVMALLGLSIAWSLIRSKMILLPVIVPIPMFMLSLIYTDLPIAHWTVFLLLLYLGTCLISGSLRVYDAEKCGMVTMVILLGVFLLGVIIRLASPPEKYIPISFEQRQRMIGDTVQDLMDDIKSAFNNRVKRTEDLTDEEEWRRTGEKILEMQTSETGEVYLRAYSLGRYERNAWRSVPEYNGTWKSMTAFGRRSGRGKDSSGDALDRMEIHSEESEMLYAPYGFIASDTSRVRESYIAANDLIEYEWMFDDEAVSESVSAEEAAYIAWAKEQYTIVDADTAARIAEYAEEAGLVNAGDNYDTALAVASYVQHHAVYSMTPGAMPEGKDFVLYFLLESREGYCVHFASATTALLQSMGIPARFVFGYRFYAVEQNWVTVTDEMAHAWTEVYEPGVGWLRIESTAGAEGWQDPFPAPPSVTPTPDPTAAPTEEPTPEPTPEPEETDDPNSSMTTDEPEPTAIPTPAQSPEAFADPQSDSDSRTENPSRPVNLWWLMWLLVPPVIAGAFYKLGQWIRRKREQDFCQKNAKKAVLAMYKYLLWLERFGISHDEQAFALAEEAAYSNHTMQEQRKVMLTIVRAAQSKVQELPKWKTWLYRWVLILV